MYFIRKIKSLTTIFTLICSVNIHTSFAHTLKIADDTSIESAFPTVNNGREEVLSVSNLDGNESSILLRFDLSAVSNGNLHNTIVEKAVLRLWIATVGNSGLIDIRRISEDWDEDTISYESAPGYNSDEVITINILSSDSQEYLSVDVTELVHDWFTGIVPNNGLVISPNDGEIGEIVDLQIASKERRNNASSLGLALFGNANESLLDEEKGTNDLTTSLEDGSGTINMIARFDTASTVADSNIYNNGTDTGFGTTAPERFVEIERNVNAASVLKITNETNGTSATAVTLYDVAGVEGRMGVSSVDFNQSGTHFAARTGFTSSGLGEGVDIIASTANADVRFYTGGSTTSNERLRIASDGNIGIGTSNPNAALVVRSGSNTNLIEAYNNTDLVFRVERNTGNVFADGTFTGGGADVAEYINVTEPVESGDVVEIDPTNAGKFRKTFEQSSTRVAGIITTEPGVVLGYNDVDSENGIERPAIALAGRVPVKANAKYGAIAIGDLLTSSPFPGYAMRCPLPDECIGAIIGKAMEPLAEGVGKVMVQVMLR